MLKMDLSNVRRMVAQWEKNNNSHDGTKYIQEGHLINVIYVSRNLNFKSGKAIINYLIIKCLFICLYFMLQTNNMAFGNGDKERISIKIDPLGTLRNIRI